jgi:carbamate kinase
MRVVVALGGSALLGSDHCLDVEAQRRQVAAAVEAIAPLAAQHQVVITHGSAPQVGLLSLQSARFPGVAPYPLDVVCAETEGMVGYLFQQELANRVRDREIVSLLTQVVVDPDDPAFGAPTKLVGPPMAEIDAIRLGGDRGWTVARDGAGFRRAVPTPEPLAVVELPTIRRLVDTGVVVICAGGGGVPVSVDASGTIRGVEAVIDKDRSAALLATLLDADVLLLLTDVPAVVSDWGTAFARSLRYVTPDELRVLPFEAHSMGPKAAAASRFVERSGKRAAIGAVTDAARVLAGAAGTQITATPHPERWYPPGDQDAALMPAAWRADPEG